MNKSLRLLRNKVKKDEQTASEFDQIGSGWATDKAAKTRAGIDDARAEISELEALQAEFNKKAPKKDDKKDDKPKKKQKGGPKKDKSDAQKKQEYLQNADLSPEEKKRVREMPPGEFDAMMAAIADEEEESMGKKASKKDFPSSAEMAKGLKQVVDVLGKDKVNKMLEKVSPKGKKASDRALLIRLASTHPVGSPERRAIIAGLTRGV